MKNKYFKYDLYLYEESANPNYTLVLTEKFTGCEVRFSTTVSYVSEPNSVKVDILKGDFENSWTVEINASRNIGHSSEFEYSLDNGAYTSDPVFRNIQRGVHELQIREVTKTHLGMALHLDPVGFPVLLPASGPLPRP